MHYSATTHWATSKILCPTKSVSKYPRSSPLICTGYFFSTFLTLPCSSVCLVLVQRVVCPTEIASRVRMAAREPFFTLFHPSSLFLRLRSVPSLLRPSVPSSVRPFVRIRPYVPPFLRCFVRSVLPPQSVGWTRESWCFPALLFSFLSDSPPSLSLHFSTCSTSHPTLSPSLLLA